MLTLRGNTTVSHMAHLLLRGMATYHPPWTYYGVDYFCPILEKHGRSRVKRHCLFTYLVTRSTNVELGTFHRCVLLFGLTKISVKERLLKSGVTTAAILSLVLLGWGTKSANWVRRQTCRISYRAEVFTGTSSHRSLPIWVGRGSRSVSFGRLRHPKKPFWRTTVWPKRY